MTLPIAVSVPHAGLEVPSWLSGRYQLSEEQTVADGDVGAFEIYSLQSDVALFARTHIARAVLDMNRAGNDLQRADGVVKTHSCWQESVWRTPLLATEVQRLLWEFHQPYHQKLSSWAGRVKLGLDCHTMSDVGPPIGPDAGCRRPLVCLSDGRGTTCSASWVAALHGCLSRYFCGEVAVNAPFAGGHITRTHGTEMPWVQLELSRTDEVSIADKRSGVQMALRDWCQLDLPP